MKKGLAIIMAMALACTFAVTALATEVTTDGVPSKTVENLKKVVEVTTSTGVEIKETFVAAVPETIPVETQAVMQELVTKAAVVDESFYSVETVAEAAALLPEGDDIKEYTLDDVIPLTVSGYEDDYGDVTIGLVSAIAYAPDAHLFGMVSLDNGVTWTAVAAEPNGITDVNDPAYGGVNVLLPAEILKAMNEGAQALLNVYSK